MRIRIPSLAALAGVAAFMIGCDMFETASVSRTPSAEEAALRAQAAADSAKAYLDSLNVIRKADSLAAATTRATWKKDSATMVANLKKIADQTKKDSIAYVTIRKKDSTVRAKKHKADSIKFAKDSISGVKLMSRDSLAFVKKMSADSLKYYKDSMAMVTKYTKDSLAWEAAQTTKFATILAKDSAAIKAAEDLIAAETETTTEKVKTANAAKLAKAQAALEKHLAAQAAAVAKAAEKMAATLAAGQAKLVADLEKRAADSTTLMTKRAADSTKSATKLDATLTKWRANFVADSTKWHTDSVAARTKLDTDSANKYTADTLKTNKTTRDSISMWKADSSFMWRKARVTFSPALDTFTTAQTVTFTTGFGTLGSNGVKIFYTTNGNNPNGSSTEYTAPITVSAGTTIKAIAVRTGYDTSLVSTKVYVIGLTETPALDDSTILSTAQVDSGWLAINRAGTAKIYYTTNGTTPTVASTALDTLKDSLKVYDTTTIKMIAVKPGAKISAVATFKPKIKVKAPVPTQADTSTVRLDTAWIKLTRKAGSRLFFTTSMSAVLPTTTSQTGWTAIDSTKDSLLRLDTVSVRIAAIKAKMMTSEVCTTRAKVKVKKPTLALSSGDSLTVGYAGQKVKITAATTGATSRYTTDLTAPTASSTAYSTLLGVTVGDTIIAIGTKTNMINSDPDSLKFEAVAQPTISMVSGDSLGDTIKVVGASGTKVRYSTTGLATGSSTKVSDNDTLFLTSTAATYYAIAVKSGLANSINDTLILTKAATPVITQVNDPGTDTTVTMASTTAGVDIYYTTDGSAPSIKNGTKYTGEVAVHAADNIKAVAVKTGEYLTSAVATKVVN